jgi:hypothetical protein
MDPFPEYIFGDGIFLILLSGGIPAFQYGHNYMYTAYV